MGRRRNKGGFYPCIGYFCNYSKVFLFFNNTMDMNEITSSLGDKISLKVIGKAKIGYESKLSQRYNDLWPL
jgi:hypothetical protein